jgi:hypothetical protein
MSATGPQLENPPPMSPSIQAQMGGSGGGATAAVAKGIADRAKAAPGPGGSTPPDLQSTMAAHPQGALLTMAEATRKVAQQMARMNPKFAPYAQRMIQIMDQGMGEVTGENSSGASAGDGSNGPASAKPPQDGGQSSPNPGFPG